MFLWHLSGLFHEINEAYFHLGLGTGPLYFRKKHKVVRMYSYLETEERKYKGVCFYCNIVGLYDTSSLLSVARALQISRCLKFSFVFAQYSPSTCKLLCGCNILDLC